VTKHSTTIAVAVFATLALAYVVTREPQVNVGVRKLTLEPVSADALTQLDFGTTRLSLEQGTWWVSAADKKYAADEALVKNVRQTLVDLKAPDFVTDSADKHAEYEVDATKGLAVKASTANGVVRDLLLGKTSRNGGAYLRGAKSNDVFVTSGSLPYEARKPLSAWRKKTVTSLRVDDVTALTITPASGTPFTLLADGTAWKLETAPPKDFRFDAAAALRLVTQLTQLNAQEFAEGEPTEPLVTTLAAQLKGGTALSVKVYARRTDGTHPVRVDGDPQTYLVAAYQAEQLARGLDGLRDLRVLHFEPGQVEKLTITAGAAKTVVTKNGDTWKVVEPVKLPAGLDFDAEQVTSALVRLSTLRAVRVEAETPSAKLGASALELSLTGGKQQVLRFGAASGSEFFAKGDDPLLYAVGANDKSFFESGLQMFKRPPPAPQGMQGLDQLPPEIRAQLEAQLRQQGR